MPANTPRGYPYPLPTEPVAEGAQAIRNLAEAIDAKGFVKIDEKILAAAAATIDFSAIPQTFTHLEVRALLRSDQNAAYTDTGFRLNGDTGANYNTEALQAVATTPTAYNRINDTSGHTGQCSGASAPASNFSSTVIRLYGYRNTALFKAADVLTTMRFASASPAVTVFTIASFWSSLAAVNRLTLILPPSWNFVIGSQAALYGIP